MYQQLLLIVRSAGTCIIQRPFFVHSLISFTLQPNNSSMDQVDETIGIVSCNDSMVLSKQAVNLPASELIGGVL